MKTKQILIFLVAFPFFCAYTSDDISSSEGLVRNKKVVIFTCGGGGGHQSVSEALKSFLQPDYEVVDVNMLTEILHPLDPVRLLTAKRYTCEDLYNNLLKRRWIWAVNNLCVWGRKLTLFKKNSIEKLIGKYLDKEKPDAIASVMPIINHSLLKESQRRNIPFVVVTK